MTTSFKDTMGADWYLGYDDKVNTSNFVAIGTMSDGPAKDKAIALAEEHMIGMLKEKGVTRDQILNPNTDVGKAFDAAMDRVENSKSNVDTRNVFQDVAYSTTSATDRKNKWGSDDDDSMGRTFFKIDPTTGESNISDDTTIADLYNKGFGRSESQMAADTTGPKYWESKLGTTDEKGKTWTIQEIAKSFAQSEEANIKSTYSDVYGRDIGDEGLNYWLEHTGEDTYTADDDNTVNVSEAARNFDASQLLRDSVDSEKLKQAGLTQYETSIRDHGWLTMGQASSQAQRATLPTNTKGQQLFTDMETEEVLGWISKIRAGEMTLPEVKDIITDRGDRMSAFNQGDSDDYTTKDINGDGIISEDERQTGTPTGMGRFASLEEIQATIDSGETPDEIRARLGKQKWGLLTHENEKTLEDFKIKSADFDKYRSTWEGGLHTGGTGTGGTGAGSFGQPGWTPEVPDKPGRPDPFPVDEKEINYMPGEKPDQFSSTPYGAAKAGFDAEQSKIQAPTQPLATQQVGQRFTGTSAKGVALKRSKRSKMGTIRGTGQLGREQQTQSLNI